MCTGALRGTCSPLTLRADSVALTFAPLSPSLPPAVDVDVRLVCRDGTVSRARIHLSASSPAGVVLNCKERVGATLSVEIWVPNGEQIGVGAVAPGMLSTSVGEISLALICPDALSVMGTLSASFVYAGEKIEKPPTRSHSASIHLVPAGLSALGTLVAAPAAAALGRGVRVSRTALPEGKHPNELAGSAPLALALCAGDPLLPGGAADRNALVNAALMALRTSPRIVLLATADRTLALIIAARAAHTPAVWLGARGVARSLGFASVHDEGPAVIHVPCRSNLLFPPLPLFDHSTTPRRSVVWAEPLVTCRRQLTGPTLPHDETAS